MITLDRVSSFIKSYIKDDEGLLGEIYSRALADKVPVMRPETRELIKTQLLLKKPLNILEVGTAVGYSALYMSQYISCEARITTIELDEERVKTAQQNINAAGKSNQIQIIQGDAAFVLKTLDTACYDFAFVDAAKGQYINYLPDVKRIVAKDGVIISDNILQDGEVLESHFVVEKRNRTIHDRMREYLYAITHDDELATSILSVADGVAISIKQGD